MLGGVDMFNFLVGGFGRVLSWLFVIGMAGCALLVIPIAAYQLFSVLFEKDSPDETNPSLRSR